MWCFQSHHSKADPGGSPLVWGLSSELPGLESETLSQKRKQQQSKEIKAMKQKKQQKEKTLQTKQQQKA